MKAKLLLKHDMTCHDSAFLTRYTALTQLSLPRVVLTRTDTSVLDTALNELCSKLETYLARPLMPVAPRAKHANCSFSKGSEALANACLHFICISLLVL